MRSLHSRLERLEAHHEATTDGRGAIGVQLTDTDEVELYGGERLTADEFRRRYPAGLIVRVNLSHELREAM
jgi:hypothetical protein